MRIRPMLASLQACPLAVIVSAVLLGSLSGCSPATVGSPVKTLPSSPEAAADPANPAAVGFREIRSRSAPAGAAGSASAAPIDQPLEEPDERLTTRLALERAIEWASDGLRLYDRGEHESARRSLSDARIILLEADLPEAIQEQGLSVLSCALSEELRHHDLEAVAEILELEARPAAELEDRELIEREVLRILRRFGAATPRAAYLETFVDEVQRYVDFYRGKHREFFERAYLRKHKYWPTIEAVFGPRSIPIELGYMALVESGFNPRAHSRADALGLWQFIPATGKRYGLRRRDDFYDVRMATEAASEYLLDLIGIFGSHSFLLATAAYNAGEGRIQGCLRELEDPFEKRNFWEIRGCLARETREYVPRIMAAAVIATDPERFGFDLPSAPEMGESYDVVTVPNVTRLSTLAQQAGTTVAVLRTANSDLSSTASATPARNFPLYVPSGRGERFASAGGGAPATQALADEMVVVRAPPPPARPAGGGAGEAIEVVVRSGDTLSEIAERHGLRYTQVASWNGLSRPYRLRVGQKLTLYPLRWPPSGGTYGAKPRIVYTVKRGNTLRTIADIFAVRYRDVMAWNGLERSTLQVGQKLEIHPPRAIRVERYQVRRGDTVAKIARRFGVPMRDVLTANGLGSRTLIRPGQKLVVYVA